MKLVFFGTAPFAVPTLRAMQEHVSLVVSQPDRASGRGLRLQPSPVKAVAEELGLRVETPERSRAPEFVELLRNEEADALLVAAYGQILSQDVLDSSIRGGINLHGSILPKYRGAAPIQRCLLNGDTETGVTLMQMARGMDTGDIIVIERTPIGADETYGELQERLADIAARVAADWMPRIVAGEYPRVRQNEEDATIAPKVEKSEAELSFDRPAPSEYNRYRAFTPAPGATLRTNRGLLRIGRASLGTESGPPGVVLSTGPSCQVAFSVGSIHLLDVQPEGKKRMTGKDYANGLRLKPGARLI